MHPFDVELIRFARTRIEDRIPNDPVAVHVASCDECRGELALMEEWLANADGHGVSEPTRSPFEETVLRFLQRRPSVIVLSPFEMPHAVTQGHSLAADGVATATAGLQHRATLYSEDPEVILRVMHDPAAQRDLLQLTAADQSMTSRVYIHLADPPMEFLTDEHGVAEMPSSAIGDPASLAWRLQLPDATFTLKPLQTTKSPDETVIDLPDGDRVAITFMPDAGGISLRVRPLRIHGQESIERVRVVVCQSGGRWQVVDSRAPGECVAANLSSDSPIEIRLFVID